MSFNKQKFLKSLLVIRDLEKILMSHLTKTGANTTHPEWVKVQMPTVPSVTRTFFCKRCSPPNNLVGVIPISHGDEATSSSQDTVPFP